MRAAACASYHVTALRTSRGASAPIDAARSRTRASNAGSSTVSRSERTTTTSVSASAPGSRSASSSSACLDSGWPTKSSAAFNESPKATSRPPAATTIASHAAIVSQGLRAQARASFSVMGVRAISVSRG